MKEFEHDFYVHLMQTSNNFKLSAIDTVDSFISIFLSHFLPLRQAKWAAKWTAIVLSMHCHRHSPSECLHQAVAAGVSVAKQAAKHKIVAYFSPAK